MKNLAIVLTACLLAVGCAVDETALRVRVQSLESQQISLQKQIDDLSDASMSTSHSIQNLSDAIVKLARR